MTHEMHLHREPFEKILSGNKRVEVRVNDGKRQNINVGDRINFTLRTDMLSVISVEITQILKAKSFFEIFRILNENETEETLLKKAESMHQYYSREDEYKYGVVGIFFCILKR